MTLIDQKLIRGTPVPITTTASTAGPFSAIQASGNGCTFITSGLPINYSDYVLAAGQVQMFGDKLASTVTLSTGECTGYRVG